MRRLALLAVVTLAALGAALPAARGSGFGLFRSYWGDVLVSTDMTAAGRALAPPTADKPAYYLGRSLGERLGSIRGDELPDKKQMNALVEKILARQGYVGAQPGLNEPTLFLVLQWGYLEPGGGQLPWFLGYNASDDIGAPVFPGLIGPEVFRTSFRSRTINTVLDGMKGPVYGIIVTAFEYKSARTLRPVVYWQTRIGLPANGKSMAEALPTMIIAASDAIGRESKSPRLFDADFYREGHVRLGDLEIKGVVEQPGPIAGARN